MGEGAVDLVDLDDFFGGGSGGEGLCWDGLYIMHARWVYEDRLGWLEVFPKCFASSSRYT